VRGGLAELQAAREAAAGGDAAQASEVAKAGRE
jgi:hypothetical protein